MTDNNDNKFSYAKNMSQNARRRSREIMAKMQAVREKPSCPSEVAPKGPLAVKNQVIGILRQTNDGGVVVPDPSFKDTDFGMVDIAKSNLNGAPFDMVVVCEILNPDGEKGHLR